MRQRYTVSLLAAIALLFFAIPRLPLHEEGLGFVFAFMWLAFAFFVISGNLLGLLYKSENTKGKTVPLIRLKKTKRRMRHYVR
ncbi:hypothetical protein [Halalkalibacterium ligniniphilum]|uniref:hypothetical protein n=1 Tax=Halalkalibacterium ligniniphilum TaxID=1134413 RepID=UPI00034B616B|nr:hypothetical protein [Halalkalibacterium ligniniphilum]